MFTLLHIIFKDYLSYLMNRSKISILDPVEEKRMEKLLKKYKKEIKAVVDKSKKQLEYAILCQFFATKL